ncbi:MAG: acetate--CoA ligase family protein [Cypionkella sp.]
MNIHARIGDETQQLSHAGWQALTNPKAIALVGASGRASSVSFTSRLVETNAGLGFSGELFLVNPSRDEIFGLKSWKSVADLPVAPDIVAINLPDHKVLPAVQEAIAAGAKALMIHSGGFGERGAEGAMREAELKRLCREAGVAALGPNCLGIMSLSNRASVSSFKAGTVKAGSVALISQSGSVAGILMQVAQRHGVSFVASTGNEAVTTAEDLIAYAIEDDQTRLIIAFVEALRRPQTLFAIAERAHAAGKPIIMLKAGLTEKGGEVSRGHTGALAGSGEIYKQALAQAGIILVEDFDELSQTVELLMTLKSYPRGVRLGMLGTSGGELGNVTDLCEALDVALPAPGATTLADLQQALVLPSDVVPRNPVDVGTGFNFAGTYQDRMRGAISALAQDPSIDMIAILQGFHKDSDKIEMSLNNEIMSAAAREAELVGKPIIAISTQSGRADPAITGLLRDAGIPALEGTREALRAVGHLGKFLAHAARPATVSGAVDWPIDLPVWDNGMAAQAHLFPALAALGVPVTACSAVNSGEAARVAVETLGLAVMKIDTSRVVHKSDAGGVALGVTPERATEVFTRLVAAISPPIGSIAGEGVMVAEQLQDGVEFYIGAKLDATFGPVVVCGMGGRMLELLGRTALLVTPFNKADALDAIARSGAVPFLSGFRGGPVADLDGLAEIIVKVGQIAQSIGTRLDVLDLNPVIVTAERPAGVVADARLILRLE